MKVITDPYLLQESSRTWHQAGRSIALVPTMGYLHEGHMSLIRAARQKADKLIVSLFVNPTQFGPAEDLSTYPRDEQNDKDVAASLGADMLFMPSPEGMYTKNHATWIEVPTLSAKLCGISRPTHFRGVCTVVAKLFLLAQPDYAFFGEKDWQQLAIIKRMTRDLHFPVKIIGMPICREADGLALSSRNAYLTAAERQEAPALYQGLLAAQKACTQGEKDTKALRNIVTTFWKASLPSGHIDYLAFVHPDSLEPVAHISEPTLLATAVRLGHTRLIDNCLIVP